MSSTERRERERAQRHQLIITAARELAEAEGWDAVTTRRLADGVGLYAEVFWGSLHGIAVLVHGKRMPAEHQGDRLDLLVGHFAPEAG
ncbi:hypothetical protein [Streptomyces milbemycinicus]|uniref:hypothetical protein n=1 Tax=Streptomyces milbemycinicus TaxID=476552 RepID=UPI0033DA8EAD